jgi:hypothetical protein
LRAVSPLKPGNRMTHWYFDSPSWSMFIYQVVYNIVTYVNEGLTRLSPAYQNTCHLPTLCVKEPIKMARLDSYIRPSVNKH